MNGVRLVVSTLNVKSSFPGRITWKEVDVCFSLWGRSFNVWVRLSRFLGLDNDWSLHCTEACYLTGISSSSSSSSSISLHCWSRLSSDNFHVFTDYLTCTVKHLFCHDTSLRWIFPVTVAVRLVLLINCAVHELGHIFPGLTLRDPNLLAGH